MLKIERIIIEKLMNISNFLDEYYKDLFYCILLVLIFYIGGLN